MYVALTVVAIVIADRLVRFFGDRTLMGLARAAFRAFTRGRRDQLVRQVIEKAKKPNDPVPVSRSGNPDQVVRIIYSNGQALFFLDPDIPLGTVQSNVAAHHIQSETPPQIVSEWPTSRPREHLKEE